MIPSEFLTRMETMLGNEYEDFLKSLDRPLQKGLRLSRRKTLKNAALPFHLEPVAWAVSGYHYGGADSNHPAVALRLIHGILGGGSGGD